MSEVPLQSIPMDLVISYLGTIRRLATLVFVNKDTRITLESYRGTSLKRNNPLLGPYSEDYLLLRWSQGGGRFLMGEVPL